MLLVDDFGRQRTTAREMLNRWIIPLEKHVDLLSLQSGRKFEVPMEEIVVFSTNLDPQALVDEAFLRRIKYKVHLGDPNEEAFREIFRRLCRAQGIEYRDGAVDWLLANHYAPTHRPLRACHPRDLLQIVSDIATFKGVNAVLSEALLDHACELYFAALASDAK
jgi:predicted ATPase with chaperone activity